MPIYEYYCPDCHTIFNFFARSLKTDRKPACPKCARPGLDRQFSVFAAIGRAKEKSPDGELPIDDAKMERAMEQLAGEAEGMSENDPRQEARLMRRFAEMTGIEYGTSMNEAIRRLEAGEDMENVDAELGSELDGDEDPFSMPGQKAGGARGARPPARDSTLYDL